MRLCECGCGVPTPIASRTDPNLNVRRGEQRRFLKGHHRRGKPMPPEIKEKMALSREGRMRSGPHHHNWKGDGASYTAIHHWVARWKKRLGRCEWCAKEGITQFANRSGLYRRDVDDFLELCPKCHTNFDRRL